MKPKVRIIIDVTPEQKQKLVDVAYYTRTTMKDVVVGHIEADYIKFVPDDKKIFPAKEDQKGE